MSDSEASAEMYLNEFESSEQDVPAPKRQKIDQTQRIAYVRSLASVELQRFIDEPPGEGMAVIYVFVNLKDGKVYVGKHEHANGGESFKASRCKRHLKPSPNSKTYFSNAIRRHGKESFDYHIIWHGPESEVDDQEQLWIGPTGLHTIKDHGGWGYNTRDGGEGGRHAPSVIAKLKAAQSTPEAKAAKSERMKAYWATLTPEERAELSERAKERHANKTPEERAELNRKNSESHSTPEYTAAASERKKAEWANKTPEERAEWVRNNSKAQSNPEVKAAHSERAKAQWDNATPEQRAEWSRKQSEAHSTPEYTAAASERAKAQFASPEARAELSERGKKQAAREAAEGKPSLGERGKATQFGNWTEEQRQEVLAKRAANIAKKRADKLSTLTGVERERQVKKYERSDRQYRVRNAKADALLKLDKYAVMNYQWRFNNVGKVQKDDGVHFFQDANGVWCAAFKTQGEGSSSSA